MGPRSASKASRSKTRMPVDTIESWPDFLEMMAGPKYRNWAFRGQRDASWPLVSSLTRYLNKHKIHRHAWAAQEDRIYRIFGRKAHLFLDHVPDDDDAFQWLALMQHHGAPSGCSTLPSLRSLLRSLPWRTLRKMPLCGVCSSPQFGHQTV
jgi:FRG domain